MIKIVSSSYLNKKLTGNNLRSKVGNIRVNDGDKAPRNLGGVALKKFIVSKLGGKTETRIEKTLKEEYGVSDSQINKRNRIMGLIKGEKKVDLTEEKEQVKRNLARSAERDDLGIKKRELYTTQYGGGRVQVASFKAATNQPVSGDPRTKGSMGDLNIKRGETRFAQESSRAKPADNPPSEAPTKGFKPIGL